MYEAYFIVRHSLRVYKYHNYSSVQTSLIRCVFFSLLWKKEFSIDPLYVCSLNSYYFLELFLGHKCQIRFSEKRGVSSPLAHNVIDRTFLASCKQACVMRANCLGLDFVKANEPTKRFAGKQIFGYFVPLSPTSPSSSSNLTHLKRRG